MTARKKEKIRIAPELASKILRTVPPNEAFYFFMGIGQYVGVHANSLTCFCNKLKLVDEKSVDFHFKRGDFEKWIRVTIGDIYLANAVDKINQSIQGEELKAKICQIVEARISQLKKLLASKESYLERS